MDSLFFGAVALTVFAILIIALTSRIGRNRARSLARVEALQALVAESGSTGPQVLEFSGSSERHAEAEARWDLPLREEVYDDTQDYDDAPEPEAPAAPPARVVDTTQQFVVNVPDTSGARPYQVSFQHKESRP